MSVRYWFYSFCWAAAAGVIVAAVMSIADWRLNPSGIFRGPEGTHWAVVAETALTWLWPVFGLSFVLAAGIHYGIARLRARGATQ